MKITVNQLRRIIKEEVQRSLNEAQLGMNKKPVTKAEILMAYKNEPATPENMDKISDMFKGRPYQMLNGEIYQIYSVYFNENYSHVNVSLGEFGDDWFSISVPRGLAQKWATGMGA